MAITIEGTLDKLVETFNEAVSRCEHCGHSQDVFMCDDCQHNVMEFFGTLVDVISLLAPGTTDREILAKMERSHQYALKLIPPYLMRDDIVE